MLLQVNYNWSRAGNIGPFPVCAIFVVLAILQNLSWLFIGTISITRVESVEYDNIWSMTANMNDANGKTSQSDYLRTNLHGKFRGFDGNMMLDDRSRYLLEWRVDAAKNRVQFALSINTSHESFNIGYDVFGLGFSERGQLVSSDFCLIWFDLSHKIHLQDAMTNSEGQLKVIDSSESNCKLLESHLDDSDISNLISGDYRKPGSTIDDGTRHHGSKDDLYGILFERPLKICEPKQNRNYYYIDDGTTHLVWFKLRGPLLSMDNLNLAELSSKKQGGGVSAHNHASRNEERGGAPNSDDFHLGLRRVQLWAHKQTSRGSSSDSAKSHKSMVHDIRMNSYKIPAQETTYWCKLFKLPGKFENHRYHITRYEAVIDPVPNHQVVHHMELFNCANLNLQQKLELDHLWTTSGGWSGNCNDKLRPKATEPCRKVILAWAMGAKPLDYPEQVGQSIGGQSYSPYVVLEIHYNNVNSQAELLDSSGLRFHYTPKLRPFDAGVLEVGLEYTDKNSIPPGMVTPLAGYCVSECTRAAMSSSFGETSSSLDREITIHSSSSRSRHRSRLGGRGNDHGSHDKTLGVFHDTDSGVEDDSVGGNNVKPSDDNKTLNSAPDTDPRFYDSNGDDDGYRDVDSNIDSKVKKLHYSLSEQRPMKQEGIFIFAAQMHTHLTGVASWTEHIREGRLIGEIQRDNHYSPHFQEIRLLKEPKQIVPGDALVHYCLYDTRERTNITLGGFSTSEEMCVTYLHYYPRIDLEVCKSSVETRALQSYFAYLASEENQNTSGNLLELRPTKEGESKIGSKEVRSVADNYNSIKWSPKLAKDLIRFYSEAPLSVQCNRSNGQRFPGYWNGIMPTKLLSTDRTISDNNQDGSCCSETLRPFSSTSTTSGQRLVQYRGLHPHQEQQLCKNERSESE